MPNPHNAFMKACCFPDALYECKIATTKNQQAFSKRAGYPLPALRHASTNLTFLQRSA